MLGSEVVSVRTLRLVQCIQPNGVKGIYVLPSSLSWSLPKTFLILLNMNHL